MKISLTRILAPALRILLALGPVAVSAADTEQPLRFGRVSVEEPAITLSKYQPLLAELGSHLGCQVELVQASSYADMTHMFRIGRVQLGILNAYSYIQISRDPRFIPIAKRIIGKDSEYRCYIITHRDSKMKSIKDLKGKTFAFSEVNSTTGYLLPNLMLRENGLQPGKDFSKIHYILQHDSIILAIANKSVDAAAVASYVFDAYDKQITNKIRIIGESDPIPYGPVVVRRDLGPELVNKIRNFFLTLHESQRGRGILEDSGFSGFAQAKDKDYDIVRKASILLGKQGLQP